MAKQKSYWGFWKIILILLWNKQINFAMAKPKPDASFDSQSIPELQNDIQHFIDEAFNNSQTDFESIIFLLRAMMAQAEIHKRQNDISNAQSLKIAQRSLLVAGISLSVGFISIVMVTITTNDQIRAAEKPQHIESRVLDSINLNIRNITAKTDNISNLVNEINQGLKINGSKIPKLKKMYLEK